MDELSLYNVNIASQALLPTPRQVKGEVPLSDKAREVVFNGRNTIAKCISGKDKRIVLVVGPCSVHDVDLALEYAQKLAKLSESVSDVFFPVMRVYFEKPRTTTGWKGLINDPDLNDSFNIEKGLLLARKLLSNICELGLPTGTEALDPIIPQYISELISWTAIGARTTESQTHRELSSGLSTPVGFKNATNGSIEVAINALKAVGEPHSFLGVTQDGQCSVFNTKGNKYGHIVLRGGLEPNYTEDKVRACADQMKAAGLVPNIMVDCSHGNSGKDFKRQPEVFNNCIEQIASGNSPIFGMMVESNLEEGNQKLSAKLKPGVSITDSCISWTTTESLILKAAERLRR